MPPLGTESGAAAQLFAERAIAAGADLPRRRGGSADRRDLDALDGMPLAIELAAARTRSMDLGELRHGLDDRFRLLGSGGRGRRPRQAALEAAVQWSYDLLTPAEQSMLRMLSVFDGGFDHAGVVGVTALDEAEVVDRIDSLVAKSLVDLRRDGSGTFAAPAAGDDPALRHGATRRVRRRRRRAGPPPRPLPPRSRRRVARPLARDGVGAPLPA